MLDPSKRKWPPTFSEIAGLSGGRVETSLWSRRLHQEGYVREGQAVALPLGFPGIALPIPADESYVTALALDDRQVVYGGTGGRRAHLFAGFTRGATGFVLEMAALEEDARVTAVLVAPDGRVLAATAPGGPGPRESPARARREGARAGAIFVHDPAPPPNDFTSGWRYPKSPARKLAVPLRGEGIAAAVMARDARGRPTVVGLGETTGRLFTYTLATRRTEIVGPVDRFRRFSRAIALGPDGLVYGTKIEGRLWRFDPRARAREIRDAGVAIPAVAGRSLRNQADSFATDAEAGILYGAGSADGVLFAFEPATGRMRCLGKPNSQQEAKGLAVTRDGRLFGVSGREGDLGRLFCHDPGTGELKDLGMLVSGLGVRTYGYEFSSAVVGRDGQVFLGQHERGGHLWLYWPSVKPRAARP